jgi:hypothetical protein
MRSLLIYDAAEKSPVGTSWRVGAAVFSRFFDELLAPKSVSELNAMLESLEGSDAFDEVQFWGHGRPGQVLLAGDRLAEPTWDRMSRLLRRRGASVVWLRVCSFAAGDAGKAAMRALANRMDAKIVGHTHIIGTWGHSGLWSLKPGESPSWPSTEGEKDGEPGKAPSSPFLPRTVSPLTMRLPSWA